MKFEKYPFSEALQKNLSILGFRKPTDIQYKCIPNILKGEDLLAIAQTGTGKTAAFAIPLIHLIDNNKKTTQGISTLIMVPTRELAIQINDVFVSLTQHTKVRSMALIGGVDQEGQINKLIKGVDILIATPGRLFDLRSQRYISFDRLKYLVLDEADHMLRRGFYDDIKALLPYLPYHRQTLFFSATIDEHIKDLAYSLVRNPIRIQLSPEDKVSKNVDHYMLEVEMDDKRFFLERLINENKNTKILVFVRTKVRADRVAIAMKRIGIETLVLHGDIAQNDRLSTISAYRDGICDVLIATDVSARGIDIPNVQFVVNYDVPTEADTYVHRVGRTGRGMSKGMAFTFCSKEEGHLYEAVEDYLGRPVKKILLDQIGYSEITQLTKSKTLTISAIADEIRLEKQKKKKK